MKADFLDAARSEFEDAIDHYDKQRFGLGLEFAEAVEQALRVRRCILHRFPYSVITIENQKAGDPESIEQQ